MAMNRYDFREPLGEGAFGSVRRAVDLDTREEVAVKTFKDKYRNVKELYAEPEVQALRSLRHPNIIQCKAYLLEEATKRAHLVFELMDMGSLESIWKERKRPFSEGEARHILREVLKAVVYMHSQDWIHRDLKPENILLSGGKPLVVKVADLGLSRHVSAASRRPLTAYVATRWYRAPEILLGKGEYGAPSDMWAVGAVIAEVLNRGQPLFPGSSTQDMLARITELRGHPAVVAWDYGTQHMVGERRVPVRYPVALDAFVPAASGPMIRLIEDLLELNPLLRPTAHEALNHELFTQRPERPITRELERSVLAGEVRYIEDEERYPRWQRRVRARRPAPPASPVRVAYYAPLEPSPSGSDIIQPKLHAGRAPLLPLRYTYAGGGSRYTTRLPQRATPLTSPNGNFTLGVDSPLE